MKISKVFLLPIFLIMIVPFLVREIPLILDGEYFRAWTGSFVVLDYFSLLKSILIISIGIVIVFFLLYLILRQVISFNKWLLCFSGVYIFLIVISVINSEFKLISTFGLIDRFEGALVLISYMLVLIYASAVLVDGKSVRNLISSIMLVFLGLSIIGVLQFYNHDPLFFSGIYNYLFPLYGSEGFRFLPSHFGRVDITMYNSNYVGSFVALAFPLSVLLFLNCQSKLKFSVLFLVSICLFMVSVGSRSRAGVLGIIISIIFSLIIGNVKVYKKLTVLGLTFILVFISMNNYAGNSLSAKFSTFLPGIEQSHFEHKNIRLSDIWISEDTVWVSVEDIRFGVKLLENDGYIVDDRMQRIIEKKGIRWNLVDVGLVDDVSYKLSKMDGSTHMTVKIGHIKFLVISSGNVTYIHNARNELVDHVDQIQACCFTSMENFASTRGYIWSRTIPLIRETIFYGNGPDTFVMFFPQNDILGKLNVYGRTNVLIDKPHNYYLQVAHDTGVLSLIILLTLFGYYIIQSIKLQFKVRKDSELKSISLAILAGVIGYLVAAIFNDSTVHVAPLFWVLLGTGFATNRLLIENID